MTYNEIISLAMQAGGTSPLTCTIQLEDDAVVRFAELVATAEREACAKVCETAEVPIDIEIWMGTKRELTAATAIGLSAAIRARGSYDGCGCCGDACANRGGDCRLKEESPPISEVTA